VAQKNRERNSPNKYLANSKGSGKILEVFAAVKFIAANTCIAPHIISTCKDEMGISYQDSIFIATIETILMQ